MKRKLIFTLIFALLVAAYSAFAAYGTSEVRIFVNGNELEYADGTPQPRIIGDRAMLPIVSTMEKVGVALNWNQETGTLVMTKDGNTATHIMYSNVLTVNGLSKAYEASSMLQDGDALIPSVMVADILGCESIWDGSMRAVIMRQLGGAGGGSLPGAAPEILSYTVNKTTLFAGEELIVTVTASEETTSVALVDLNGVITAASGQYSKVGYNNSFVIRHTPQTGSGSLIQFNLQAGDADGFYPASSRSLFVNINNKSDKTSAPAVSSYKPLPAVTALTIRGFDYSNKTYITGESVSVTVRTSLAAEAIEVFDKSARKTTRYTKYTESGSSRLFRITVTPSVSGSNSYEVTAYDRYRSSAVRTFSLNAASYTKPVYTNKQIFYKPAYSYPFSYCWNYPYYWDYPYYYCDWSWRGTYLMSFEGPYSYINSYGFNVYTSASVYSVRAVDSRGRTYYPSYSPAGGRSRWSFTVPNDSGGVLVTAYNRGGIVLESRYVYPTNLNPGFSPNPVYKGASAAEARRRITSSSYRIDAPQGRTPSLVSDTLRQLVINASGDAAQTLTWSTLEVSPAVDTSVTGTFQYNIRVIIRDVYGAVENFSVPAVVTVYASNTATPADSNDEELPPISADDAVNDSDDSASGGDTAEEPADDADVPADEDRYVPIN